MSVENNPRHLPAYQSFLDAISVLGLPVSASELHGIMCGYLCAGAVSEGESYIRALMLKQTKDETTRTAALAMFNVYTVSQEQMKNFDFQFQLMLPDEHEPLIDRAQAFSEWCEGFTQGMTIVGVSYDQLNEEESQEALQHLAEFAQLDYQSLEVDEEDERALMEVSEYTRMAVLRLYGDLLSNDDGPDTPATAH